MLLLTLLEDVGLQQMVDFPASHLFPNSQHHTLLTAYGLHLRMAALMS